MLCELLFDLNTTELLDDKTDRIGMLEDRRVELRVGRADVLPPCLGLCHLFGAELAVCFTL